MTTWNGKEYKTYAEIREEYGMYEREVIIHIEDCLENGSLYAYFENSTGTILKKYQNIKLPNTRAFIRWGNHDTDYDGTYHGADHLMFFEEELTPHNLVLRLTDTITQNDPHDLWEKGLETLSFNDHRKYKKLLAYYKVNILGEDIQATLEVLGVEKTTLYTYRKEGEDIAKQLGLPLPEQT